MSNSKDIFNDIDLSISKEMEELQLSDQWMEAVIARQKKQQKVHISPSQTLVYVVLIISLFNIGMFVYTISNKSTSQAQAPRDYSIITDELFISNRSLHY